MSDADIPGVKVEHLRPHPDERGWFLEVGRGRSHGVSFVQWNHSHSEEGVLRGLHYHRRQSDLWYPARGAAQVALVDLRNRRDPPVTQALELSSDHPSTLFIPPGVAHGFLALTPVDMIYAVTEEFDATDEYGIAWDDPKLGIEWRRGDPILSERDRNNPVLRWDEIPRF